jgi:hypothetical protein
VINWQICIELRLIVESEMENFRQDVDDAACMEDISCAKIKDSDVWAFEGLKSADSLALMTSLGWV